MTPIDPRYYEMSDELRGIEREIVNGKDELQSEIAPCKGKYFTSKSN